MQRWNVKKHQDVENKAIDLFIEEVIAVCKQHGMSIGHEDYHGAFEVVPYSEEMAEWIRWAHDSI